MASSSAKDEEKTPPSLREEEQMGNKLKLMALLGSQFHKVSDEINWVTLPLSRMEAPKMIRFRPWMVDSSTMNIIVAQAENLRAMRKVNKDLNIEMNKLIAGPLKHYEHVFPNYYVKGLVVAAKDDRRKWKRAIITSKSETYPHLDVIFVDSGMPSCGMHMKDVCLIPKCFVVMPFQAIGLSLSHIAPTIGFNWSQATLEFILKHCGELELSTVVTSLKRSNIVELNQYGTTLWNTYNAYVFNPFLVEIGGRLVDEGFAQYKFRELQKWKVVRYHLVTQNDEYYEGISPILETIDPMVDVAHQESAGLREPENRIKQVEQLKKKDGQAGTTAPNTKHRCIIS